MDEIHVDHIRSTPVRLASGNWVCLDHEVARLITCGDFVEAFDEDGRTVGACGAPVVGEEGFACEGHTAERNNWLNMGEMDRSEWERERDRFEQFG